MWGLITKRIHQNAVAMQVQISTLDIEFISSTIEYLNEVYSMLGFFCSNYWYLDSQSSIYTVIGLNIDLKVSLPYTLYGTRVFNYFAVSFM